jgi:hypothetical protein
MNSKGSSSILLVFVFLAFLAAAGLAYHYKMQRDKYYNQLNNVYDAHIQTNL